MRQVISLISAADLPWSTSCWRIRFAASMAVWEWNSAMIGLLDSISWMGRGNREIRRMNTRIRNLE